LSRFLPGSTTKRVYLPNPTIEEEACAIRDAGLEIRLYRFFDPRTGIVDWEGMREDLQDAPEQSAVLLYVGGSTPTGAELTAAQWRLATEVLKVGSNGSILCYTTITLTEALYSKKDMSLW
jgi:aspartate/tyrosine/aromatic aminotransferase